jgi:hypothetical protein
MADDPAPTFTQQVEGNKIIFYIDGIGGPTKTDAYSITSDTIVLNFATIACSISYPTDCFSSSWYVKLIVANSTLNLTSSTAGLGSQTIPF